MVVTIDKNKHVVDGNETARWQQYINSSDCPLYRAIKEQHPEFDLAAVTGHGTVITGTREKYHSIPSTPWDYEVFDNFYKSEKQEYLVVLQPI